MENRATSFSPQDKVEEEAAALVKAGKKDEAIKLLEEKQLEWSSDTREFLRTTFYQIVSKFHDGLVYGNPAGESVTVHSLFYPKEWLETIGFFSPRFRVVQNSKIRSLGGSNGSLNANPSTGLSLITVVSMICTVVLALKLFYSSKRGRYLPIGN